MIFYYTRLFDIAMFTHVGHVLMIAHFLFVGYLFIWCMIGVDRRRTARYPSAS